MLEAINPPADVPRAQLDPITTLSEKLCVFSLALMRPLRYETLVLCRDAQHRGVGLFAFDSKHELSVIIDRIIGSVINIEAVASISLCTARRGRGRNDRDKSEFAIAKTRCNDAGIALADWFLVAHGDVYQNN